MEEKDKPKTIPSDYQSQFQKKPPGLEKILAGITDKTVVVGGKLDPREMAQKSYNKYKEHHTNMAEGEGHDCEALWMDSLASTLLAIGVPTILIQVILNEWMKIIRADKPDFLEGGDPKNH
mgnify:CR=1 FL=1